MKKSLPYFLSLLALVLSSCNLSGAQQTASGPRAWFDQPLPGTVVRPPNPCQVVAHAASAQGISLYEISVNGQVTASLPNQDPQKTLVTLGYDCGSLKPGRNLLRLRAQDKAGTWSDYAETTVILEAGETRPSETPTATGETVTVTETAAPTLTETPTATLAATDTSTPSPTAQVRGSVSIERISTNLVFIGASACGPMQVTILARATAAQGIKAVVLFYRFATTSGKTEFQSVAMGSNGPDLYQAMLSPSALLGGAVPFDKATLEYQVVVQQDDGDTSIRTPILSDIKVQAC